MFRTLIATAITLVAFETWGFELNKTEDGDHVHFSISKIEIVLDSSLKKLGPADEVELAVIDMFEMWIEKANLPLSFNFVHGDCKEIGYDSKGDNDNCVMASEDTKLWERPNGGDPGATTIVSYMPLSGEIVDADIVFNSIDWEWSTNGDVNGTLNLHTVAAHEIGHLLGLSHTAEDEAIMFPVTHLNDSTAPVLHKDDISGASLIYSGNWNETAPYIANCNGMAVAAGGTPSSWFHFALFLMAVLWWRLRTRVLTLLTKRC